MDERGGALLVVALACHVMGSVAQAAPPAARAGCTTRVSAAADRRIAPILVDLVRAEAFGTVTQTGIDSAEVYRDRAAERIARLFPDPSPGADEALAALTRIYAGEHTAEELDCVLIARGPRVLPLLERFERCIPRGARWRVPAGLVLDPEFAHSLLELVRAGEECDLDEEE